MLEELCTAPEASQYHHQLTDVTLGASGLWQEPGQELMGPPHQHKTFFVAAPGSMFAKKNVRGKNIKNINLVINLAHPDTNVKIRD